ncbi:MAG: double-cubane-cluster-containing anaerobic reductase [Candidatus Aenigmatarchaeota archaeon]
MGLKETIIGDVSENSLKPLEKRYHKRNISMTDETKDFEGIFYEYTKRNLLQMQKSKNRAKVMEYFDQIISGKRMNEIREEKAKGRKIIGFMCNLVPQELIIATGAVPVRLCSGFYDSCDIAEEALPRDICPLVKSTFGCKLLEMEPFRYCDALIIPACCDAKKKLSDTLADYMTVFVLDIPSVKDTEKARKYWLSEVKELSKKLENFTKSKIGKKELWNAIKLLYERTRAFRRLYEIRKCQKTVISGMDSMLVTNTAFFDEPARWASKVNELCDELEEKINKGIVIESESKPRVMITGSAIIWPNYKIFEVAEQSGLNIVMDQLCSGTELLYEPVEVDEITYEDMISAVAERYLLPSMCPIFFSQDDRADRIVEMVEQFRIQGVIYHTLRLCQVFDMESESIRHALQEKKIPFLKIITDYSQEDVEQIRTRMEAFREMLEGKKTNVKRENYDNSGN